MAGIPLYVETWGEQLQPEENSHTNEVGYYADSGHDFSVPRDGVFNYAPGVQKCGHPQLFNSPLHQPRPSIDEDFDFPRDPRPIFHKPPAIVRLVPEPTTAKSISEKPPTAGSSSKAKKFPCTWDAACPQSFTCPHNREQHIREKHTFERPNVCPVCANVGTEKSFSRPFALYRHLREVHKRSVPMGKGNRPKGQAGVVVLEGRITKAPPVKGRGAKGPGARGVCGLEETNRAEEEDATVSSPLHAGGGVHTGLPDRGNTHVEDLRCSFCHILVETQNQLQMHQHDNHCTPMHEGCPCTRWLNHHNSMDESLFPGPPAGTGIVQKLPTSPDASDASFEANMVVQLQAYLREGL